jgi:hypothetical protein
VPERTGVNNVTTNYREAPVLDVYFGVSLVGGLLCHPSSTPVQITIEMIFQFSKRFSSLFEHVILLRDAPAEQASTTGA